MNKRVWFARDVLFGLGALLMVSGFAIILVLFPPVQHEVPGCYPGPALQLGADCRQVTSQVSLRLGARLLYPFFGLGLMIAGAALLLVDWYSQSQRWGRRNPVR